MTIANLYALLKADEGVSKKLYYLNQIPHIGVGHQLASGPDLSDAVVDMILHDDVAMMEAQCARLPFWATLSEVRQAVVISMAFNLGMAGLLGFANMLHALTVGDWDAASQEMLNSKAHTQATARYDRLALMMASDTWPS